VRLDRKYLHRIDAMAIHHPHAALEELSRSSAGKLRAALRDGPRHNGRSLDDVIAADTVAHERSQPDGPSMKSITSACSA
jgi:hypothetical protein